MNTATESAVRFLTPDSQRPTLSDAAAYLNVGRNKLFRLLRERGDLKICPRTGANLPSRRMVLCGFMGTELRSYRNQYNNHQQYEVVFITARGLMHLREVLNEAEEAANQ